MNTLVPILAWIRNVLVGIGLYIGFRLFSAWQAAGQNYNLMEAKGFLTAMMLVILPIVVVGGLKAFMDDKVRDGISRGKLYLDKGDLPQALIHLNLAIEALQATHTRILPQEEIAYLYRGMVFARMEDRVKAEADFKRITGISAATADTMPEWGKLINLAQNELAKLRGEFPGEQNEAGS